MYREPAAIEDAEVEELRDFGYSDRQIADVVALVAQNVLTGSFNLVAGLHAEREDLDSLPGALLVTLSA